MGFVFFLEKQKWSIISQLKSLVQKVKDGFFEKV
jgi:hypothetical protein